jgi:hypothetical protein
MNTSKSWWSLLPPLRETGPKYVLEALERSFRYDPKHEYSNDNAKRYPIKTLAA